MSAQALDGYDENPRDIGRPIVERPFRLNGDFDSIVVRRRLKHRAELYAPAPLLTPDAIHPAARLVHETDPGETQTGPIWFERTFVTVPMDQISVGSRVITKPAASSMGVFSSLNVIAGGATVTQTGAEYGQHLWADNKVYGPIHAATSANTAFDTRVTCAGHGIAGTEQIVVRLNSGHYRRYDPPGYAVVDANTVDILGESWGTSFNAIGRKLRDYTPGTARVGVRLVQRFYLPGVTAGVATEADIPIPGTLLNDADFLAAVIANTSGYVTYDASELAKWNAWAIYTQTFTEVNFGNV